MKLTNGLIAFGITLLAYVGGRVAGMGEAEMSVLAGLLGVFGHKLVADDRVSELKQEVKDIKNA